MTPMTKQNQLYDEFLRIQAENSFDLEIPLYRRFPCWKDANHVIDFGCGNGAYMKLLSTRYPDKCYTGVEIIPELATLATHRANNANCECICGSFADLPPSTSFDFLLLRFVTSYLPDRTALWQWVSDHASIQAGILIIDADDSNFYIEPQLPAFFEEVLRFYERVDETGGQRDVRKIIQNELRDIGFEQTYSQNIVVHSDTSGRREAMQVYLSLGTEYDTGSPLPTEIAAELHDWLLTPTSFAQYGIFGSLFTRK